ncbi:MULTISPECIES: FecCD family ABC transporter permease [Brevibacterium]|uniref:Heme ABC transporter permease n=1 Tax=Brevibacterium paucivorans TaxID=170994 RepID=A0A2N6VQB7_9MICO|nr:iron ABC transporter permease [Brevibacterium paucivorans]MCG7299106.1 iron ABC transporter permease [Brevibacterium sp. ACRRH]PMD06324.1 heme ABC transporter permease [Brevibacterium paucivorans]
MTTVFTTLAVLLLGGTLLSAMLGQLYIAPKEVVGSVLQSVGITWLPGPSHEFGAEALWEVRFPRIVLTVFVGAALAIAGAVMQGIFGNPLAEPGTIGVSSGAAVGASFAFLHGLSFLGGFTVPLLAFVCGLVTTIVVYVLARSNGRTEVVTLILTGVAVNAISGALISFIVFKAPTQAREQIVFWQMGSFNGSRWEQVAIVVPLVVVGIVLTMFLARGLDLVSLGEKAARHLGVDVERLRLYAMVLSALLVSAAVAFVGIIAFVGLVVPHLMRMLLGPGHRLLLPASVLGGAVLLTFADLAARTLIEFADLPIGMLTALIGGPYFFYLLRRSRREAGGWA